MRIGLSVITELVSDLTLKPNPNPRLGFVLGLGLGLGVRVRVRVRLDGMLSYTRLRCFLAPGSAPNICSGPC